ncbi:homogentisate phytyltransferase 1 [Citrus sinensis]|uniref:Homogentisate phytyltransferase 1 n=1 Tax=Citrus sinensis TaxID=2711 RepID=A0ACB8KAT6_CITSI|nr:homogentisate phytyltransferase 1 [Citrus sinensis]
MQCLSFPPKNHPLQQKSFQPPLTYRRKSSIIECSSRSSFRLNNQIKIAVNNEGIISNRNQHKPSNGHLVPLALQDGYALQSENDHTAAATPSFLEVFKRKLNGIAHLTRPYAWINIAIVPTILMNVFLCAINQICDVEIDKINKPYLPLASGDLSIGTAIAICVGCTLMSLAMGVMSGSPALLWAQILWFLTGCAYSLPLPFLRWKSHTFMAPFTLVILMGLLLQIPFFIHSQTYVLGRPFIMTRSFIFTTAIMSIFAFVNGLLKDLPDVEGDKAFGMQTLCVLLGKEKVLPLCVNLMLIGYGGAIIAGSSSSSIISKLVTLNYIEYFLIHFLR